jgi:hypothetical protein
MAMRRLRERSQDIDLFHPDSAFSAIALDLAARAHIELDVTNRTNLWGNIEVADIEADAEVVERLEIEGFGIEIAAISPETLFVIKASSMREKDRDDLPLLLPATTPKRVMARADALISTLNDSFLAGEAVINMILELQIVTLELATPDWFLDAPRLSTQYRTLLLEYFGVELRSTKHPRCR